MEKEEELNDSVFNTYALTIEAALFVFCSVVVFWYRLDCLTIVAAELLTSCCHDDEERTGEEGITEGLFLLSTNHGGPLLFFFFSLECRCACIFAYFEAWPLSVPLHFEAPVQTAPT